MLIIDSNMIKYFSHKAVTKVIMFKNLFWRHFQHEVCS
jgi:hypothetical protein